MKTLVTGAAGFLGWWVAEELSFRGHAAVGLDDLSGGDNEACGWPLIRGSVLDLDAVTEAAAGCEAVVHCAALPYEGLSVFSPSIVVQNIVVGSVNVAVAAARQGIRRVVNCSSMARYGDAPTPYGEDAEPKPVDPYGLAKLAAERQLDLLGRVHGFEVVHAVPHNIYGPRQCCTDPYRNVAAIFCSLMLQGKPPTVYGDGKQVRCFSYVTDVVPMLVELLTCEARHGEVFNVGPDGGEVEIGELARLLAGIIGWEGGVLRQPDRPCEVKHALCSSAKIRRRFGFQAKVPLEAGLGQLVKWVRGRGPRPFNYRLPVEIVSERTPKTWTERLI